MRLFRKLAILAVMAVAITGAFAQGDPKAILNDLNQIRIQKQTELRNANKPMTLEIFNAINAEIKAKAIEAIKDVSVSKVEAKDAFDWARVFQLAERHKDVCDLAHKFLMSNPTPEQRYAAQMLMMESCNALGEADMLAETLVSVSPTTPQAAIGLANSAARYADTIAKKKGVDAAIKTLEAVEKSMVYEDPEAIADRSLKQRMANPQTAPKTPEEEEKLKQTLLTQAKGQKDAIRFTFAEAKAQMLVDANRTQDAVKVLDAYLTSLPEGSAAARNASMFKTRLTIKGAPAPALDIERGYGGVKSLAELKGKVVIVDTFAHWCGPCIASFPDMRKMYDDLKDKGLEIVGVTTYYGYYKTERPLDKDAEFARMADFMKENNMNWPVVYGDRSNFEKYGVTGIPTVFIIDRNGNVVDLHVGYSADSFKKFREEVEKLLGK